MRKRLLATLLCLCMVATLLPSAALAEDVTKYDVWIMGISRFNSDNLSKTCGSGTATLNVTTTPYTLTLEDATIGSFESGSAVYGIRTDVDLNIVLKGTNVINSASTSKATAYGICATGNLTISGNGSLTINCDVPKGGVTNSFGIRANQSLTINASGTVTANGTDGSNTAGRSNWGIYVGDDMTVNNGTVAATGGLADESYGIVVKDKLNITGGTVTANGGSSEGSSTRCYGLRSNGPVTVSGGSLTAHGYAATQSNYGIRADEEQASLTVKTGAVVAASCSGAAESSSFAVYTQSFELQGGTVTATGGSAAKESYGVFCSGTMSVSDGELTATGGNTPEASYGLRCTGALSVSGGTLTANGISGASPKNNYGFFAGGGVTVSNGAVIANGNAAATNSYGIYAAAFGVSNGTVTATSGEATTGNSYAIVAEGCFTLENGTVSATGGNAPANGIGLYCHKTIGISGGELTANVNNENTSGKSYGVYTPESMTVSDGKVTASGNAAGKTGYGIAANGGLTLTGGETTVTGKLIAVSKQPGFGTVAPKWYKWKANTTASAPTGAYTRSRVTAYAHTSNDKYLNIVPDPSKASISNVTVSGKPNEAITPADLTLTLTQESFKAVSADADVSQWFTNLPAGLSAKTNAAVNENATSATVTISGTPTSSSVAAIAVTIPAAALSSGSALPATENAGAKWAILADTAVSPSSAVFDKYTSAADYGDKVFTITLAPESDYTLSAITLDDATLTESTDYTVSGSTYTIKKETLAALTVGSHTVVFDMSGGADPQAALTVTDSTPTSYTITYNGNGGSGTMADSIVPIGETLTLPECGFTPPVSGSFKEWAIGSADSAERVAPGTPYTFTGPTTVYAVWEALKGDLNIQIIDENNKPVEGVTVKAFRGSTELQSTTSNVDGEFRILGLCYGVYSLVGTKDNRTVTDIITVKQSSESGYLILPNINMNSVVETAVNAPPVAVSKLNELYQDHNLISNDVQDKDKKGITAADMAVIKSGGSAKLKLEAEAKPIESSSEATKIKGALGGSDSLSLLVDLNVTKTITPASGEPAVTRLTELPLLVDIYIELPESLRGKTNLKVLRIHDGEVQTLPHNDETFSYTDDGNYLVLRVRRFSSYAIAQIGAPVHTGSSPSYSYYTVTASAGDGGSISPSGAVSVREGQSKSFAVTPNAGYAIADVLADGVGVKNELQNSTYTFKNVQRSHTISATFILESEVNPPSNPFDDVGETDWFYEDVMFAYDGGLMLGTGDAIFSPLDATTRAMVTATIWRMEGSPAAGTSGFPDISDGEWYSLPVAWARQKGIAEGFDSGLFVGDGLVTREQLAAFLYRYAAYKGYDTSASGSLDEFIDKDEISDYAVDAMTWAVGCGLINGTQDNMLSPRGDATRAQIAAMLRRFTQKYALS